MDKFEDFGMDKRLIRAIEEMGFTTPTPIQEKCIPIVKQGKDVVGQSSTGSGKTAAFGLPILENVEKGKGLQFVILTPTRELCLQVKDALSEFSKYLGLHVAAIYGGTSMGRQIEELKSSEVMVGTPGRVLDHLQRHTIKMGFVKWLVLDEADRMLDMGFIDDVEKITSTMPKERQTLLFSATIPNEIRQIINKHLKNPEYIKTESYIDKSHLHQVYYKLKQEDKFSFLVHLLKTKSSGFALVFCSTRRHVDSITRNLLVQNVEAIAIHGGMPQNKRLNSLDKLKRSSTHVLVATDVAARGLDIKNITHIFNYDVPKTANEYIHRIGRTARAGAEGDAITFVTPMDKENFRRVLSDESLEIRNEAVLEHEHFPFNAKTGANRRDRPHNRFRAGKPKRGFSYIPPRKHAPNSNGESSSGQAGKSSHIRKPGEGAHTPSHKNFKPRRPNNKHRRGKNR